MIKEFEVIEERTANITVTESNVVVEKEKAKPVFKIESLDYLGLMKVSFSQSMHVVEDLASFSITNVGLELLHNESIEQDESDENYDPSKFDFAWVVTEFTNKTMTIQVTFTTPEYISAGL